MSNVNARGYRRWIILLLLFSFMLINFCDKAVFGIAAPSIMKDLGLNSSEFGALAGSFFYLFSLSIIFFGKISERISSTRLLLCGALIWTVAQLPIGFVASVPYFFASRILLGFGEGPSAPLCNHVAFTWFENKERDLPGALVNLGAFAGLLISGPILTHIILKYGWHRAYLALSFASLLWGVIWFFVGKDGPYSGLATKSSPASGFRAPYRRLFLNRTFLGAVCITWASYFAFSLIFSWVPSYIQKVLHFDESATGWVFMLFTFLGLPIVLITSFVSRRLQLHGVSSKYARGWLNGGLILISGMLIIGALNLRIDPDVRAVVLAVAWNIPQVSFVLTNTIVSEITPDSQRSIVLCALAAIATTAGLIAPALTGRFLESSTGAEAGFHNAFGVVGALLITSALLGFCLIDPEGSRRKNFAQAGAMSLTSEDAPGLS